MAKYLFLLSLLPLPRGASAQEKLPEVHTEVTVHPDAVDAAAPARVEIDRRTVEQMPVQSISSPMASLLTLTSPGVAADSNGSFHPLGDHAELSFFLDGQPITDQQGRTFASPVPLGVVGSLEVQQGTPAAEVGDKTSMLVMARTRSGFDAQRPVGSISVGGGSFHTQDSAGTYAFQQKRWASFSYFDELRTARFLDAPELTTLHGDGWSFNLFEHVDYHASSKTTARMSASLARTWFETPNTFDQQAIQQDQSQSIHGFNIAPSVQHVFSEGLLTEALVWVRRDAIVYTPSPEIFSDAPATLSQQRSLTNAGLRNVWSWTHGAHFVRAGGDWLHTFLNEEFATGLTSPTYNSPCVNADGTPSADTTLRDASQCASAGLSANTNFLPGLSHIDLTRGGGLFHFNGHTDIKQLSGFVQDTVRLHNVTLSLGLRGERYNGLTSSGGLQPRASIAYSLLNNRIALRAGYARIFLTPYNENLIVASSSGPGSTASTLGAQASSPLHTATRNQFNAGMEAQMMRRLSFSAEYFWKFTYGAYDFDVLLNSPLAFPTQFRKSKIDGGMVHISLADTHGLHGFATVSHVRSRLFGPAIGGVSFSAPYGDVTRPDHDEGLAMNLYLQQQIGRRGPWVSMTYRYDGGLVAVAVPDTTALTLTGDEQAQMGLRCGGMFASVAMPLRSCSDGLTSTRIRIPRAGTENDDRNPSRIAVRNVVDVAVGKDDLFQHGRQRLGIQVSVTNVGNVDGLYNFLSTFAGTHFLAPRSVQVHLRYGF